MKVPESHKRIFARKPCVTDVLCNRENDFPNHIMCVRVRVRVRVRVLCACACAWCVCVCVCVCVCGCVCVCVIILGPIVGVGVPK